MSDFQNPFVRGMLGGQAAANQNTAQQINSLGGLLSLQNNMETAPLQRELLKAQVFKAQNPLPIMKDLGGAIGVFDPRTMQQIGSIPKSATQDAVLREQGAAARHSTASGDAIMRQEGENFRFQNPSANAQLSAETARRGQNMVDARARETIAQGGKAPPGYRYTPDGNMEAVPGGPADIKAQDAIQKKIAGSGDVDVALGTLRNAYDRLEKGGGITSTKNSAIGNIIPSLGSSVAGQAVGKALGTENQSARNDIAMARPALLAALMKATGMSAKQMDSNAELKLWLSTATDPTLDIQANRRALDNIERKYISNPTPQRRSTDKPAADKGIEFQGYTFPSQDALNAYKKAAGL